MSDGSIKIDTEIDTKGIDKGLNSVKGKVNNAAKDMNKDAKATNALKTALNETGGAASSFASKMESLASSGDTVASGITASVLAAKKFIETLKEANKAYKGQEKAEDALQKAADNNPYLDGDSVHRLKEYASTIQGFSKYGDNGITNIMAQLASTGRTESEIMKTMGAAADYAAAKHIDLKTAAKSLNSTYSGMAGTMGRQIADIKDLTEEQLKNGKAVDIIAKKYKGFAQKAEASSGLAIKAGITAAILAAKKYIETLKQANEAYKVQKKAEDALSKAAENNPYLNRKSVQHLKEYASELQKVTNYGDEGTIDVMAQLAAAGRSESEIIKLIGAAADYAAAKHISLESAVQNLNKSYGGLAGELGELFPEVKALTSEQLKNGEAVDIIAAKYKGFAAEAADSGTQAKNAFGDFMESVGKIANPTFEELDRQSTSFWEGMTKKMNKFNDALETASRKWGIGGIHRAVNEGVNVINRTYTDSETGQEERGVDFQKTEYLKWLKEELELRKELKEDEQSVLAEINIELKYREGRAEREKKAADAKAKAAEEKNRNQDTIDYIKANTEARKEALAVLELTAASENRSVTAEEKLSVFASSYVDLITKSEGKVTKTNEAAKSLLETTIAMSEEIQTQNELKEEAEKIETKLREALDDIAEKDNRKESEKIREQIKILEEYYLLAMNNAQIESKAKIEIEKEFVEKKKVLMALETEAEEIEAQTRIQNRKEMYSKIAEIATRFTKEYAGIMSTISEMATEQINNEAILKTDALEKEYAKGEMSAEDYEKKLLDIKREAANEKYKIDMWVWASNIAAAIASTALGVAQALADPSIANAGLKIGLASLIGLAGAVQLSSILSNKPIPPQFATGGVVPGSSYTGDKMIISTNSAERVLTAQQNAAFEKLAFGQTAQSGPSIKIYNSASNDVSAKPEMSEGEILIMIEKTVSKQMESGKYNSAFKTMQGGLNGVRYTN